MKFIALNQEDSQFVTNVLAEENKVVDEFYRYAKDMGLSDQSLILSQGESKKVVGFRPKAWETIQSISDVQLLMGPNHPVRTSGDFEVTEEKFDISIAPSTEGKFKDIRNKMDSTEFSANDEICEFLGLKPSKEFSMVEFSIDNTARFNLGITELDGYVYIAYNELQGDSERGSKISEEAFDAVSS